MQRHLEFATIGHGGIPIGPRLRDAGALGGVAMCVLGHGCVNGALFFDAGLLLHRRTTLDVGGLPGRGVTSAGPAWRSLAGVGLAGLVPFGTATGKAQVEAAARAAGHDWINPALAVGSALTAGADLRAAAPVFLGWGDPAPEGGPASRKGGQPPPITTGRPRRSWSCRSRRW